MELFNIKQFVKCSLQEVQQVEVEGKHAIDSPGQKFAVKHFLVTP